MLAAVLGPVTRCEVYIRRMYFESLFNFLLFFIFLLLFIFLLGFTPAGAATLVITRLLLSSWWQRQLGSFHWQYNTVSRGPET